MARTSIQLWTMHCGCQVHEVVEYDDDGKAISKDFCTREEAEDILRDRIKKGQRDTRHPDFDRQPPFRVCKEHAALGHKENGRAHFDVVREEQLRHSVAFNVLQSEIPDLTVDEVVRAFDPVTRELTVFSPRHNASQRGRSQAALDMRFGSGKVRIVANV